MSEEQSKIEWLLEELRSGVPFAGDGEDGTELYDIDAAKKSAEMATSAATDLQANWHAFCDADHFDGNVDFPERMEAAGLIELVPVDADALEDAFAYERGIEPGGMMWALTAAGRTALSPA